VKQARGGGEGISGPNPGLAILETGDFMTRERNRVNPRGRGLTGKIPIDKIPVNRRKHRMHRQGTSTKNVPTKPLAAGNVNGESRRQTRNPGKLSSTAGGMVPDPKE
jgi:hypothetical protein